MTKPEDLDSLLVVVGTEAQARVVEVALSTRGIAARVRPEEAGVIEFGLRLGSRPLGIYALREDLARAKELLSAKGLPNLDAAPDVRSTFGL